jgi:PAS domain S-box-containing protein
VNQRSDLDRVLGASWSEVLSRVGDAVLVLDRQRILRFVNDRARQLLGYDAKQAVGARCRLTTRGVDCENACPLTFALEHNIDRVEDFATVYRAHDGRAVPLEVTVIPLRDDDGEFLGAVEILRPGEPDLGFFLRASAPSVQAVKTRLARLGRARRHLVLVGEPPVCLDVARVVHRFSGLPDELFEVWDGSWEGRPSWPPGTLYAHGDGVASLVAAGAPEGWQVVVGSSQVDEGLAGSLSAVLVELPSARELSDDLALMAAAWTRQLAPGMCLAPGAVERLCRLGRDGGFRALERALVAAVASAGERIEEEHVPADGYGNRLVDELLQNERPLAALEQRLLTEVLQRCGWRMQEAADRLGVSRVTLWRKCRDHGIERPECGT